MSILLSPVTWALLFILTASGVAFSYAKYIAVEAGTDQILKYHQDLNQDHLKKVMELFQRHGSIILLLSAIPGLDTVVALSAGAAHVTKRTFIFWVTIAKLLRWFFVALIVSGGFHLFSRS